MIPINLTDQNQADKLHSYINTLASSDKASLEHLSDDKQITAWVNGLNLACPMPLLKTKIALRDMPVGDSIYVLATDPNSQTDLAAFCQHANLEIEFTAQSHNVSLLDPVDGLEKLDTIFHLIITKTYGN